MVNCHSETTLSRGARNTSRKSNVRSWNGRRCSRMNSASAICALPSRRRNRRQGQALLEFSILIPLIIILIGATLSFGLFFFQANVLQQAVDVAAQEISRMPFEPDQELGLGQLDQCGEPNLVSNDPDFKSRIYDEQYLVIHDDEWGSSTSYGQSHLGATSRKEASNALPDRTRACQNKDFGFRETQVSSSSQNRGCRCGVSTVGIHHHRHTHRTKKATFDRRQKFFARGHIATAYKDRGLMQIFRASSKHATVHQTLDLIQRDSGVPEQLINISIHSNHRVKNAAMRV